MDRLIGIDGKIERAKEHVSKVESEIGRFFETGPYELFPYDDPETGDYCFAVRVRQLPPPRIGVIAGEAIHALRSSLDYLVYELVLANGGQPTEHHHFPIYKSADKFESSGLRVIKGVSNEAVELIRALKPYKGGNDGFWTLHELNRREKHRFLMPVFSSSTDVRIDLPGLFSEISEPGDPPAFPGQFLSFGSPRRSPLNDGDIVWRIRRGVTVPKAMKEPYLRIEIAFGEGEIVQGEPLIPTLTQFVGLVEGAVEPFRPLLS